MTAPQVFYSGVDYEQSSDPYLPITVQRTDCWPLNGLTMVDGDHPVLALTPVAGRPNCPVGVVVTVDAHNPALATDTLRVVANPQLGPIVRAWVCNITGYGDAVANAWAATLAFGTPIYVDDSVEVGSAQAPGCTLSLSAANSATALNPLAGYAWRCQDEEVDTAVGGANAEVFPKAFASGTDEDWLLVCVLLFPGPRT